ncbi:hypothetical protein [Paenibacillus sp. J2TS4]|uniref:hypothetical protein n=1 Tax=Paenibacillus sp. J2TS4 TaxID=2807194 RepID=UPI001B09BE9F|nr:hypothetical protein [Paenibacillus sp. J2TS4]GIP36685.1 hypothetical protein J2TS4_58950 [Paenibacillus sp. J2TS4]
MSIIKSSKIYWFLLGWIAILALIGVSLTSLPNAALAKEGPLDVQIQIGLDGKIKPNKWFPVKFTITNSGDDVSGELAVQVAGGNRDTTYVQQVDLPKQSTKEVTLALPGGEWNKRNNSVKFYKDSVESGKTVDWSSGSVYIETSAIPAETVQVGIVARDPDTMNFLNLLNQRGYEVRTFPMSSAEFPQESFMLDSLDVLVLNDFASDQFQPEQVQAISGWIQRGGKLFLAGGAGYSKTAQPFAEWSPVIYQGTENVTDLSTLAGSSGKELVLTEPFTLSRATVKDGIKTNIHHSQNGIPLFVSTEKGRGEVWYIAYDTSLNPLASWNGNAEIWEGVLSDLLKQSAAGQSRGYYGSAGWELNNALDYFPSLTPPSVGILVLVIIIYAAVIGPILYFTLKKLDRREWMWFTIPLLAIVFSLGIYGVGASGRGAVMAQSLTTIELDGAGQGVESSATAVFVPKGGNFRMQIPDSLYVSSINNNGPGDLRGSSDQIIHKQPEGTDIRFQGVSYWSIRKVMLQKDRLETVGKFDYKAESGPSGMTGELTNRTGQRLTNVHVYMNGQLVTLGDMNADETASFQLTSNQGYGSSYPYDTAQMIFPYGGRNDVNSHKRALLVNYLEQNMMKLSDGKPYVFGWSEAKGQTAYQVGGKSVSTDEVTLWTQSLNVDYVSGSNIYLPPGTVTPVPDSNSTILHGMGGNGVYDVGQGEITLDYRLPEIEGAVYQRLTLFQTYDGYGGIQYEVWNESNQTWEPVDETTKISDGLGDYLLEQNVLRFKITFAQDTSIKFPDIAVEGAVSP